MDAFRLGMAAFLASSVLAAALAVGPARAEDEPAAPPPPPAPEAAPPEGERDPFSPSEKIRSGTDGSGQPRFVPHETTAQIPKLALKGYIEDADGNTVALLEVEGSATYLVREGDTVTLPTRRRNEVIRVMEVGNLALRVQVGELKHEVVVR